MQTPKLEKRSFKIEVRSDDAAAPPRIVGYAAVYNELSGPLVDAHSGTVFRERIAPGTFAAALADNPDVRLLVNHDPSLLLARTKSGTLRLTDDEHGLRIEADPPDTQLGRDTLTVMRRGDMDQMSFAFYVQADEWTVEEIEGHKTPVRTLRALAVDDVSVVTYPAYEATNVEVRTKPAPQPTGVPHVETMLKILEIEGHKS
jgi:HK97 family phage prohead protease